MPSLLAGVGQLSLLAKLCYGLQKSVSQNICKLYGNKLDITFHAVLLAAPLRVLSVPNKRCHMRCKIIITLLHCEWNQTKVHWE